MAKPKSKVKPSSMTLKDFYERAPGQAPMSTRLPNKSGEIKFPSIGSSDSETIGSRLSDVSLGGSGHDYYRGGVTQSVRGLYPNNNSYDTTSRKLAYQQASPYYPQPRAAGQPRLASALPGAGPYGLRFADFAPPRDEGLLPFHHGEYGQPKPPASAFDVGGYAPSADSLAFHNYPLGPPQACGPSGWEALGANPPPPPPPPRAGVDPAHPSIMTPPQHSPRAPPLSRSRGSDSPLSLTMEDAADSAKSAASHASSQRSSDEEEHSSGGAPQQPTQDAAVTKSETPPEGPPAPPVEARRGRPQLYLKPRTAPLPMAPAPAPPQGADGCAEGTWGGSGSRERPRRLQLQPRSARPAAATAASSPGARSSSVFGSARPREEVLKERGVEPADMTSPPAPALSLLARVPPGLAPRGTPAPPGADSWQTVSHTRRPSGQHHGSGFPSSLPCDPFFGGRDLPGAPFEGGYGGRGNLFPGFAVVPGSEVEDDLDPGDGFPGRRGLPTVHDDLF